MNDPTTVLVVDDNLLSTLIALNGLLMREPRGPERFKLQRLSDPRQLSSYLDQHKVDVVIVDAEFEKVTRDATCLTAFRTLMTRGGPPTIGFAQDAPSRLLYPFAVCQLFPPPEHQVLVGWAYKNDTGLDEIMKILNLINTTDRPLPPPDGLLRCMPEAPITGQFMSRILMSRADAMLWREMSYSHYSHQDLALAANISKDTVPARISKFFKEIRQFQRAMEADTFHPRGAQAAHNIPDSPDSGSGRRAESNPKKRAVESFAQVHHGFFQAPELVDIVVEHHMYPKGRRRNPWWRNVRPR
jgi:hypothetical protein